MKVDPNHQLFDRVPELFVSPFPGADSYADRAFEALMARESGRGGETIGQALLAQAGTSAWNQATQLVWKSKATLAGDLLSDV